LSRDSLLSYVIVRPSRTWISTQTPLPKILARKTPASSAERICALGILHLGKLSELAPRNCPVGIFYTLDASRAGWNASRYARLAEAQLPEKDNNSSQQLGMARQWSFG